MLGRSTRNIGANDPVRQRIAGRKVVNIKHTANRSARAGGRDYDNTTIEAAEIRLRVIGLGGVVHVRFVLVLHIARYGENDVHDTRESMTRPPALSQCAGFNRVRNRAHRSLVRLLCRAHGRRVDMPFTTFFHV